METRTLTLADFLLARIAEDESAAREAEPGLTWIADGGTVYAGHPTNDVVDYTNAAAHIARHDPARVLAECEAKRQIVTRWEFAVGQASNADEGWEMIAGALEDCVCSLAAVYANHPDYREEWR